MDTTVPNNPNDSNNPTDPNAADPIEPGQFVTSPNNGVFGQPPPPQPEPSISQAPAPTPPVAPTVPEPSSPTIPQPDLQLAGEIPQSMQAPGSPSDTTPAVSPNQPNPFPYVPPDQTGQQSPQGSPTIGKLRGLLIVVGLVLLLGGIAAAAWFFVLNKSQQSSSTTAGEVQVEAPPTPQSSTSGGFSELPPATEEGQFESTSSPQ